MKQVILEKPTKTFQRLSSLAESEMYDEIKKIGFDGGDVKGITRQEADVLLRGTQYSISKKDVMKGLDIAKIPYCNVMGFDKYTWHVCSTKIDNLTDEQLESLEKQHMAIRSFTVNVGFRRDISFEIPKMVHLRGEI